MNCRRLRMIRMISASANHFICLYPGALFAFVQPVLPFNVRNLSGDFSIAHSEWVHAVQVSWLAVSYLAIHPTYNRSIADYNHLLSLESCIGIVRVPPASEIALVRPRPP